MIPAIAIIGIVILDSIAICHGIDGTLLSTSIGAVFTIAGWNLKKLHDIRKKRQEILKP
jgi:hypothetical protein